MLISPYIAYNLIVIVVGAVVGRAVESLNTVITDGERVNERSSSGKLIYCLRGQQYQRKMKKIYLQHRRSFAATCMLSGAPRLRGCGAAGLRGCGHQARKRDDTGVCVHLLR